MEIYFLTPGQAYPRLQNLHINSGCTRAHEGAITTFSSEQKELLLSLMMDIENLMVSYSSDIGKVEFVLLERGVYWDFPFTWGKTMIMITPKIFTKPKNLIKKILAHEWVHLDQRRNVWKYESFYRTLGFRKQHIDFGALQPYLLRNPDADNYEWIWRDQENDPTYVPAALLRSCTFSDVLLEIRDVQRSDHGDNARVIIHKVEDVPEYYRRFGVKKQLYHPNEISAHLIADLLIDQVRYVQIDQSQLESLL
jgi:hypothetical protein